MSRSVTSAVFIGDTHISGKNGLCPANVGIDYDCSFNASEAQGYVWRWWEEFVEGIPRATRGNPYVLVHGGDIIEGVHHRSTGAITNDIQVQVQMAADIMRPLVDNAAAYYQVAGTPAHDGESWCDANVVARLLGAVPYTARQFVHPELLLRVGDALVHDTHHISVSGMHRTQATGPQSEHIEQITDAGLCGDEAPLVVVRHHSHYGKMIGTFFRDGMWGHSIKCPSWQIKGPYPYKTGSRNLASHYGGVVMNWITDPWGTPQMEIWPFTRGVGRPKPLVIEVPRRRRK